tara:strand:+ start:281027 stop:281416 length:390 start_codon:yes stop_codon:yes gene_type:complete
MMSFVINMVTMVLIVVVPVMAIVMVVMFYWFKICFEWALCWFVLLVELMFAVELLCSVGNGLLMSRRKFVIVCSGEAAVFCRIIFCVFQIFLVVVLGGELLSLRRPVVLFGGDSLQRRISLRGRSPISL